MLHIKSFTSKEVGDFFIMYIEERCVIMYIREVFTIGVMYVFCDCSFVGNHH